MKNDARRNSVENPKTSKLAIASLVLAILSFLLFILTALPAIILGVAALVKIFSSRGKLKGIGLSLAAIIIAWLACLTLTQAGFFLWSLDAPPIPNDYTIADLRAAPPECSPSYDLLMSLGDKGDADRDDAPAIGLSAQDVNTIHRINDILKEADHNKIAEVVETNADAINQAWVNAKKGRDIITRINTFPEIADLSEPNLYAETSFLPNAKRLAHLYQSYVYLQVQQGNRNEAVNKLIKLDSLFRKLSLNARSTVTKLVCYAGLNAGITTANFIANNPQTQQESLDVLAAHFKPLKDEHSSLRNQLVFEYLTFKNTLNTQFRQHDIRNIPLLKFNSMFRLYRNFCEHWISLTEGPQKSESREQSVWPSVYPNLPPVSIDSQGRVPRYYMCYNPIGSLLIQIIAPTCNRLFELKTNLQIQDDLFQIVLNKRLGKEVSLKARAYSDEYIIDLERKIIFSPGPDGKAYTKDDIKLVINPEVLGFED